MKKYFLLTIASLFLTASSTSFCMLSCYNKHNFRKKSFHYTSLQNVMSTLKRNKPIFDTPQECELADCVPNIFILLDQTDRAALQRTCRYWDFLTSLDATLKHKMTYDEQKKYFEASTTPKQRDVFSQQSENIFRMAVRNKHETVQCFIASTESGPWQMFIDEENEKINNQ